MVKALLYQSGFRSGVALSHPVSKGQLSYDVQAGPGTAWVISGHHTARRTASWLHCSSDPVAGKT